MVTPALGQRWVSQTESDLGVGTVVALCERTISLLFPASGEVRMYTRNEAPITRVRFDIHEEVTSHEDWSMRVEQIQEENGLLIYHGERLDINQPVCLPETFINHFLKLNKPQERLFTGHFDSISHFRIRQATHKHLNQTRLRSTRGLQGARIELLPHQLYLSHEIGSRLAPRVLLADEVGLGKTIEAGLIVSRQLLTGRAQRVLIIVPKHLQIQWLVEMRRRFNLQCVLFDESRSQALQVGNDNPFEAAQVIICSLDWLCSNTQRRQQVQQTFWDMLLVDEAHHLHWSLESVSDEYALIARLAARIHSVLLLTATPEQLGQEGHFARLHLLDPLRFPDLQSFLEEEKRYTQVSPVAEALLAPEPLSEPHLATLAALLNVDQPLQDDAHQRHHWLKALIDRAGTSRLLYRNTRKSLGGFKPRHVHFYVLPASEHFDSRQAWLHHYLDQTYEKTLLICADDNMAQFIADCLKTTRGTRVAILHTQMSIAECDRAAGYFAQYEQGAQILVSSEVGAQGRNFQFAQHLILFDLPLNPDQLEQRIGRLDRIGQNADVHIHVPYVENSEQAYLSRWYHEGLNVFTQPNQAAARVFAKLAERFLDALKLPTITTTIDAYIEEAKDLNETFAQQLESGRNRLQELHSSGLNDGHILKETMLQVERDTSFYMYALELFDEMGLDCEEGFDHTLVIKPSHNMALTHIDHLPEDGLTTTFNRYYALYREDIEFLTGEHPFVYDLMQQVLDAKLGSSSVALLNNAALKSGTIMLEAIYLVEPVSTRFIDSFCPPTPIRLLLDAQGNDIGKAVTSEVLEKQLKPAKKQLANQLVQASRELIQTLLKQGQTLATQQQTQILMEKQADIQVYFDQEIERLSALKKVNPSVRESELEQLQTQKQHLLEQLQQSKIKLDAVRFIVAAATR